MKCSLIALAFVVSALCSAIALGSLYSWNDAKRPPIALSDALDRAEKLLGDDAANRYCVSVSLYGDETGDGNKGAWNLFYAAADGSKKHVYINMQGESTVQLWNGPIDWKKNEGRRNDLDDVRRRFEDLFAKEGIAAKIVVEDGSLLVTHHTREFQVYRKLDDGGFGEEIEQVTGPSSDGIWLHVRVVDKPDRRNYGYDNEPYWRAVRGTYFLAQANKFITVDLRYGPMVKYEVVRQMWQIFGEPTPRE